MTAQVGQFDHLPEVYDFLTFLKRPDVAIEGHSKSKDKIFTPKTVLQAHFNGQRGLLQQLLNQTLSGERHIPPPGTVLKDFIAVFATLLVIGQPQFLQRFIEQNLCDDRLPFDVEPPSFPATTDGISFFDRFRAAQWRFCPLAFRCDGVNYHVQPEYVLPLCQRIQLRRSPPATVFKVVIHEQYDPFGESALATTNVVSDVEVPCNQPSSQCLNRTYVFKEFSGAHAKEAYDKELDAFLHLQKAGSQLGKTIIGFYGSFIYGDTPTIILEYADRGTLDEFLKDTPAPEAGEDIIRLWDGLLRLQVALNTIHNIPTGTLVMPAEDRQHSALRG